MTQLANIMRLKTKAPEVGDGMTVFHYTDRSCGTVTRVSKSGKTAWYKPDRATRIDDLGATDSGQRYSYETIQDAPEFKITLRKNGEWKTEGRYTGGKKVVFGIRDAYHDYSF